MITMTRIERFVFSEDAPVFIKRAMVEEFMRIKPYASDALNSHFKDWDSEYDGVSLVDYREFMNKKQKEVLETVNKDYPSAMIRLDVGEDGDIIAIGPGGVTMYRSWVIVD